LLKETGSFTNCFKIHAVPYADEIIWPDGDDTLPVDAQDLITRLLNQSPLERLGTGALSASIVVTNCSYI